MKDPGWMCDKLQALAIEADLMLGSCDASDILDTLEEARNAMSEGAEVIARLMAELEQAKRERDAAVADLTDAVKLDLTACDVCKYNGEEACLNSIGAYECAMNSGKGWEWRGLQEVKEDA